MHEKKVPLSGRCHGSAVEVNGQSGSSMRQWRWKNQKLQESRSSVRGHSHGRKVQGWIPAYPNVKVNFKLLQEPKIY